MGTILSAEATLALLTYPQVIEREQATSMRNSEPLFGIFFGPVSAAFAALLFIVVAAVVVWDQWGSVYMLFGAVPGLMGLLALIYLPEAIEESLKDRKGGVITVVGTIASHHFKDFPWSDRPKECYLTIERDTIEACDSDKSTSEETTLTGVRNLVFEVSDKLYNQVKDGDRVSVAYYRRTNTLVRLDWAESNTTKSTAHET